MNSTSGSNISDYNTPLQICPLDVQKRLESDEPTVIIDCRTQQERVICSISGSHHIPLHELEHRMEELNNDMHSMLVVHCHHGVRSLQAAELLRANGFDHACSMIGGISRWADLIDSSIPKY